MKRRHWLAGAAAAALAGGGWPLGAMAQASRQWHFDVLMGRTKMGYHHFDLSGDGPQRDLRCEADLDLKLMGISVYRYHHESTERWDGDCLQAIDSRTQDNKRELWVKGRREGEAFVLDNRDGQTRLPGCVMSFAYWNPRVLRQAQLLNPQNGKMTQASAVDKGEDTVEVRGKSVAARKYELSTKGSPVELWYAEGGTEWVALALTLAGQRMSYRLV